MRFTGWNKSLLDGKEHFGIGFDGEGNPVGHDPLNILLKPPMPHFIWKIIKVRAYGEIVSQFLPRIVSQCNANSFFFCMSSI